MISRTVNIAIGIIFIAFIGAAVGIRIQLELQSYALAASVCTPPRVVADIDAQSAFVFDIHNNRILFEKEGDQQMPLASLTKLMTALVAHESLGRDALITISDESFEPEGDSGLLLNEVWRSGDLIDFTLMTSSNDGAHTLALETAQRERVKGSDFYTLMNTKSSELSLGQTFFLNPTGLDVSSSTSGAYGSARDVAYLLAYAQENAPEAFDRSSEASRTFISVSGFEHEAQHTSSLASTLPRGAIIKTGFTDLAGGNLGVIVEPILGNPVAIVVLGSSRESREQDIERLHDAVKRTLRYESSCNSI